MSKAETRTFELTGKPVSKQMEDILSRMEKGEDVSIDEIESTREIKAARKHMSTECIDIFDESRKKIQKNAMVKMEAIGSAEVARDGTIDYQGEVKHNGRLDIIIGLPASGKSTAIINDVSAEFGSKLVDSDEAKKMLPEYDHGYGAQAVHKESQMIERDTFRLGLMHNDNIIIPKVGSIVENLVKEYIQPAKDRNYQVYVHFVDLPKEKALGRLLNRLIEDNRFIEPRIYERYVTKEEGNKIEKSYETLKQSNLIDGYSKWDNDVQRGEKAILLEANGLEGHFIDEARKDGRTVIDGQNYELSQKYSKLELRYSRGVFPDGSLCVDLEAMHADPDYIKMQKEQTANSHISRDQMQEAFDSYRVPEMDEYNKNQKSGFEEQDQPVSHTDIDTR